MGAVPVLDRGLGHTAPTYICRDLAGSIAPTAFAAFIFWSVPAPPASGIEAELKQRRGCTVVDPTAVAAAKQGLRVTSKRIRAQTFAQHGRSAAEKIAAHGIGFVDPHPHAVVSAYLPIGEEIDPLPLTLRLWREGFRIALPVIESKVEPLRFREWTPGDPLLEKAWGIREPLASAPQLDPDVMLVPLLAFDAEGHRLGYGGGFYDRTLAAARAGRTVFAIGLAYDEQEVPAVPRSDFDQRLDWVLTPSGPRRCVSGQ